ncbi:hypothetical protein NH26_12415 [Flammeovirga pacifica]|uniref:Uncharacterized protein n=1 Tax=Flammeovirga pacifica TaxID=915059 RepID=A0A1S1Z1E4_FLAPC|nr:hypothetical protein NH26_12415 [Flammeovirga pacifica]
MFESCSDNDSTTENESDQSIFESFDQWFDDEELKDYEKTQNTDKEESETPVVIEVKPYEEPEVINNDLNIEEEEPFDEAEEADEVEEEIEEEIPLAEASNENFEYAFDHIGISFKSDRKVNFKEIKIEKKHIEKGLLHRFKTTYSYFDVYDMDKSIQWSGAGDFSEFGQGFYERSKMVRNGKFAVFAGRRCFMFDAKASVKNDYNYSSIKRLKSDFTIDEDDLVDVKVVFFGRKNLGYRMIYAANDPHIEALERSAMVYEPVQE